MMYYYFKTEKFSYINWVQNWFKFFVSFCMKKLVDNYVHFYLKYAPGTQAWIIFNLVSPERWILALYNGEPFDPETNLVFGML